MAFDLESAKPVSGGFDTASAKPLTPAKQSLADRIISNGVGGAFALGKPVPTGYDAGGLATDYAAKVLPPEAAAGVGLAANVAFDAIPALAGGTLGKSFAGPMEAGAQRLMKSAVKPTLNDWQTGKGQRAIDTLLNEGINPTKGGMDVIRGKVNDLNAQIAYLIKQSPATVSKGAAAATLQDNLQRALLQANPQTDVKAIEDALTEFLRHPLMAGANDIPVQLAQQIKQGTYKAVGDRAYGELGTAATEAQKGLASGLREEIGRAVPEVVPINAKERELLNALSVAERRALLDQNSNILGISPLAHGPVGLAAYMADKSALVKSLIARAMHSGAVRIPQAIGIGIGSNIGGQSGREPQ